MILRKIHRDSPCGCPFAGRRGRRPLRVGALRFILCKIEPCSVGREFSTKTGILLSVVQIFPCRGNHPPLREDMKLTQITPADFIKMKSAGVIIIYITCFREIAYSLSAGLLSACIWRTCSLRRTSKSASICALNLPCTLKKISEMPYRKRAIAGVTQKMNQKPCNTLLSVSRTMLPNTSLCAT